MDLNLSIIRMEQNRYYVVELTATVYKMYRTLVKRFYCFSQIPSLHVLTKWFLTKNCILNTSKNLVPLIFGHPLTEMHPDLSKCFSSLSHSANS